MLKKFTVATTLSFALLFGGLFHAQVDAAAGTSGDTEQKVYKNYNYKKNFWNKYNSYFNNCKFVWKNGELVIEQPEAQPEEEAVETPAEPEAPAEVEEAPTETPEEVEEAPTPEVEQDNNQADTENDALNAFERQVFELTNNERTKNGLAPLQVDYEVSKVAREKSRDMAVNGYFDHNSPTYGSPFDMMRSFGITYRTAGENIAKGQRSPEEVVNAWMNSPGHRANILNGDFTHIGVGYIEQGNVWTQQFIGK